jgi:hypothetical protein
MSGGRKRNYSTHAARVSKKQNIVKSARTTKTLIQDVTPDDYQSAQAGTTV